MQLNFSFPDGAVNKSRQASDEEVKPSFSSVATQSVKVQLEEATVLEEKYAVKYSWQQQCQGLFRKMVQLVFGKNYIYAVFSLLFCFTYQCTIISVITGVAKKLFELPLGWL